MHTRADQQPGTPRHARGRPRGSREERRSPRHSESHEGRRAGLDVVRMDRGAQGRSRPVAGSRALGSRHPFARWFWPGAEFAAGFVRGHVRSCAAKVRSFSTFHPLLTMCSPCAHHGKDDPPRDAVRRHPRLPVEVLTAQASTGPPADGSDALAVSEYRDSGHYRLIAATGELIPEPRGGGRSTARRTVAWSSPC